MNRILALFPSEHSAQRVIKGIARYRRTRAAADWMLDIREIHDLKPNDLKLTREYFDGVISNITHGGYGRLIKSITIPAVFLHTDLDRMNLTRRAADFGYLFTDNYAVAECAVDYLVRRGFTSFAYVGAPVAYRWSEERAAAVARFLSQRGLLCRVYPRISAVMARNFSLEEARLGAWLKRLPPQTAIIAANDLRAEQILETCRKLDLHVPRDLAIIGIDNDAERCEATVPSLTSVQIDFEEAGYLAAEALDRMLRVRATGAPPVPPFALPFGSPAVVERESSCERLSDDALVRRARAIINAAHGVRVSTKTLIERLRVSERSLQTHFIAALGRTPSAEINRVRLDHLKAQLLNPMQTLADIAGACGFCSTAHLACWFRRHTGQTPTAFRQGNLTEKNGA